MTTINGTKPPTTSILERLPGKFPKAQIAEGVDLERVALSVLQHFPRLGEDNLTKGALWCDSYGLTGIMRTIYGQGHIIENWTLLRGRREVTAATLVNGSCRVMRISPEHCWLECRFVFSTSKPATECSGFLSLVPSEDGTWKIWLLRTILEQLTGCANVDELRPASRETSNGESKKDLSVTSNGHPDSQGLGNGTASTNGDAGSPKSNIGHAGQDSLKQRFFQAVIVGGGQSGLSTAGRLAALGVSYIVLEANEQVGDAWRSRYTSAKLQTIREYAHLPFNRTFGPECGEYLGKEELADGHQKWAQDYGINVSLSTTLESGFWDARQEIYCLTIRRNGLPSQIFTRNVVFATGAGSQTPMIPEIPGKDKFQGTIMHSAAYVDADNWRGRSGIVIGTANTGHDVADDMVQAGMKVTMVQRSRTFVLPVEYIEDRYKVLYNAKTPTEQSDRTMFTNPVSIARLLSATAFHAMARAQPERWAALEKAGFKVDPYGDIQEAVSIRLGGHYIDVGTSAKISKGLITMKSGPIATFTLTALAFADGTAIPADVVVFATGFVGNLHAHVAAILGSEVADRAGDCFGLTEEGEVRGAFQPLEQPGLWYLGGALGHARYYSRFIALSIKAEAMGKPLPVFRPV